MSRAQVAKLPGWSCASLHLGPEHWETRSAKNKEKMLSIGGVTSQHSQMVGIILDVLR